MARSFHRDIVNLNDFFYVFLGHPLSWDNESVPAIPVDTRAYLAEVQRQVMGVKRVTPLDAVLLIDRIDWEPGTVYARYDDVEPMVGKNFYVMTDTFRVYKCLGNANSSFSTVNPASEDPLLSPEPLTTIVEKFSTSDGYWWQFMFEVPVSDRLKFLTDELIPVRFYSTSNSFDYNGIVDTVEVTTGGSGYTTPPTVVILGDGYGATAVATLDGTSVDEVTITNGGEGYTYAMVNFVSDSGTGAVGVVNLVGAETPIDVNEAVAAYAAATAGSIEFVDVVDGGAGYSPATTTLTVRGDGQNCVVTPVINNGIIERVVVVSIGSGYTFAEIEVDSPTGVGAEFRAVVGPPGGHGSNLPLELGATVVGISVTFPDSLEDLFLGNEFRQYGVLKNLRTPAGEIFTASTGRATYLLSVPDATEYLPDDRVLSSSGGEFLVVSINTSTNRVTLLPIIDALVVSDTLENLRSAQSGLAIDAIEEIPEFNKYSGKVLLVDNITPITRQDDQAETITLHIQF